MNFIVYDIGFLIVFAIFVSLFLYSRRKNLKKEGLLFLYKTSWGIKLINYVGEKYQRTLKVLSYVSVGVGYILMAGMIYLFGRIVWIYVSMPSVVEQIKVPPIMPLVPYIDKVVDGIPSFYFTYWILIIAVIAITHEFAHGIFSVYNKIKIKSTGFGFFPFFLPVFLAAFVEPDEEQMQKGSNFSQRAILSAGTFANVITAVLFFIILILFFSTVFVPSGIMFNSYAYSTIDVGEIQSINNLSISNITYSELLASLEGNELNKIKTADENYILTTELAEQPENEILFEEGGKIVLYYDAPAINAELEGIITQIRGVEITSVYILAEELNKHNPGEKIIITTIVEDEEKNFEIVLGQNPEDKNSPWVGIVFIGSESEGIIGKAYSVMAYFREDNIYYKSSLGEAGEFIYYLLWWIVLISISVALINMLPVGIFDGGKFFYLTVLGITKSKKIAQRAFKGVTYLVIAVLILLMGLWIVNVI